MRKVKNVNLHCAWKDSFAVVEGWVQSSLSEDPRMLQLEVVSQDAICLLSLDVYSRLNG